MVHSHYVLISACSSSMHFVWFQTVLHHAHPVLVMVHLIVKTVSVVTTRIQPPHAENAHSPVLIVKMPVKQFVPTVWMSVVQVVFALSVYLATTSTLLPTCVKVCAIKLDIYVRSCFMCEWNCIFGTWNYEYDNSV